MIPLPTGLVVRSRSRQSLRICLAVGQVVAVVLALLAPASVWAQAIGPEFPVNTYTTGDQSLAKVAADSTGNFVVVWSSFDQDGDSWGIFGQRFSNTGSPLGTEFQVNTFVSGNQLRPALAMDRSGNFVVVWWSLGQDGDDYGIYGQRADSTGNPVGTEFKVNTNTTDAQRDASVAMDNSGSFVVVWSSLGQDGDSWGVYGQRYDSLGPPASSEFQVNTYTTSHQSAPAIAIDGSGDFVVVWQSFGQDGDGAGVYGQRFDNAGGALGVEFRVNSYTTSFQSSPSIAVHSSGDFVVVWQSFGQDGDSDGIYAQRYASSGAPAGSEFQVSTYFYNIQRTPSIAMHPSGAFVVVWQGKEQDQGIQDFGIIGRQYDNAGNPLGPEFVVNTFYEGPQERPSVAVGSAGGNIVVWQSHLQDGDGFGVYGQRNGP
jgi:hypothetical protein